MLLDNIVIYTTAFVRRREYWAAPLVFILAFGESPAFLSLLLAATVVLPAPGAFGSQRPAGFFG